MRVGSGAGVNSVEVTVFPILLPQNWNTLALLREIPWTDVFVMYLTLNGGSLSVFYICFYRVERNDIGQETSDIFSLCYESCFRYKENRGKKFSFSERLVKISFSFV